MQGIDRGRKRGDRAFGRQREYNSGIDLIGINAHLVFDFLSLPFHCAHHLFVGILSHHPELQKPQDSKEKYPCLDHGVESGYVGCALWGRAALVSVSLPGEPRHGDGPTGGFGTKPAALDR